MLEMLWRCSGDVVEMSNVILQTLMLISEMSMSKFFAPEMSIEIGDVFSAFSKSRRYCGDVVEMLWRCSGDVPEMLWRCCGDVVEMS